MARSAAQRFVDAVHRRLMLRRSVKQLAWGMLPACCLAIVLNVIAILGSMPTIPILLVCGCLGLFVGTVLIIVRWPTRFEATVAADKQLDFDDLLISALFRQSTLQDDFCAIVAAMADEKCKAHSPNEVAFGELTPRVTIGIGVVMCLAITLGIVPFGSSKSQAEDANVAVLSNNLSAAADPAAIAKMPQIINAPTSDTAWAMQPSAADDSDTAHSVDNLTQTGTSDHGSGGQGLNGSLVTHEREMNQKLTRPGFAQQSFKSGEAAAGGTASHVDKQRGEVSVDAQSETSPPEETVTHWKGRAAGNDSHPSSPLAGEDVPPAYRDMVRDFFAGR